MDGSIVFYLNWTDYVRGFGNLSGEYWLGLSTLHHLANGSVSTLLRVDMRDIYGNSAYASYSTFYLDIMELLKTLLHIITSRNFLLKTMIMINIVVVIVLFIILVHGSRNTAMTLT